MTIYRLTPILERLGACSEARAWVAHEQHATFADAWAACPRGDWMLWLARVLDDRRPAVLAACEIAEIAVRAHCAEGTDARRASERAIETARRWTRGEATREECAAACAAAYAAAYAAADAAAYAAAYAAHAAHAAAYAAAYAAHAADRGASLRASADIVRRHIDAATMERALIAYATREGRLVEVTP